MSGKYSLSFQTLLPDDFERNTAFSSLLATLQDLGFWGVELNMSDPDRFEPGAVCRFLRRFDLELSMLATGVTAKGLQLSLSHADEDMRKRSVEKCRQMIEWAASTQGVASTKTGVILGFMKGGVAPDAVEARARFARSLSEIIPHAERRSVAVLVEATNRYESSIANSLEDTARLLDGFGPGSAQMLPDTFHMNIEEADMRESLRAHLDRFTSLHLSDNNRFFPGFGAIDFGGLLEFLKRIGYQGRLAIEGNVRGSVESDLRASTARLRPFLET